MSTTMDREWYLGRERIDDNSICLYTKNGFLNYKECLNSESEDIKRRIKELSKNISIDNFVLNYLITGRKTFYFLNKDEDRGSKIDRYTLALSKFEKERNLSRYFDLK